MAKNIQILKRSTVEIPDISSYKLVLEAVNAQNMPSKIFVNQRIRNFSKGTTDDSFAAVCTPVQLEDFAEDSPDPGSSYYRTSMVEIVVRTPEMLQTAFDSIIYEVKKLVADLEALEDLSSEEVYNIGATIEPTGISNLTTAQVSALTSNQIAALSTAEVSELTSTQIAALQTTQIVALESAQIAAFTTDQVKALSTTQIAAIEVRDIPSLTTAQVETLSTAQVKALTTAQLAAMEPEDVAAVSPAAIGQLSTDQIKAFSVAELAAFTLPQVAEITTAQRTALSTQQRNALPVIPQFPVPPPTPGFWLDEKTVPGNVARIVDLADFANNVVRANIGNAASWSIAPISYLDAQGNVRYDNWGVKFNIDNISYTPSKAVLTVVYKNNAAAPRRPGDGKDAQGYQYPHLYITSLNGKINGDISVKWNGQTVFSATSGTLPTGNFDYLPDDPANFGPIEGRLAPDQVTAFVIEIDAVGSAVAISGELFMAYS